MVRTLILGLLMLVPGSVYAQPTAPAEPQMKCEVGPINRMFGGTPWLVYSCDDQSSMVVVSAPGNPAMPFYFFLKIDSGAYKIIGEGAGVKSKSDAAARDIQKLQQPDFAALLAETRRLSPSAR